MVSGFMGKEKCNKIDEKSENQTEPNSRQFEGIDSNKTNDSFCITTETIHMEEHGHSIPQRNITIHKNLRTREISPSNVIDMQSPQLSNAELKFRNDAEKERMGVMVQPRSGLDTIAEVACQLAALKSQVNTKKRKMHALAQINMLESHTMTKLSKVEEILREVREDTKKSIQDLRVSVEDNVCERNNATSAREKRSERDLDNSRFVVSMHNEEVNIESGNHKDSMEFEIQTEEEKEKAQLERENSSGEDGCWDAAIAGSYDETQVKERGKKQKRRRDNWSEVENRIFMAIAVNESGHMDEMELRRKLTREFAPRRTHEQCANHLRILRSQGKIPAGKAIGKRSPEM